jgi:hypothetical protein
MRNLVCLLPLLGLVVAACAHTQVPGVPVSSREVHFKGYGGFDLAGTLALPAGTGKFPAVLLIPGSGPTDRDGNEPFIQMDVLKDIAERLQADGIATLRFDKRAVQRYSKQWPKTAAKLDDFFSWEAFVGDAAGAYDCLKTQPEIDANRLAILGHSEGGLLALEVAKTSHPHALVLVSTPGRDFGALILEQISQGYSAQFTDAATLKARVAQVKRIVDAVRTTGKVPPDVPAELAPVFPSYLSRYLHSTFMLDPAADAKLFDGPALIVQGQKDIQVSPDRDAPKLKSAIKNSELFYVPGASHCMKAVSGPTDPGLTGPMLPDALDKISSWLKANL